MQKLRVTTTITVVREAPYDSDHYPSMSLDEAVAYERGERPLEKDERDIVGEFAETIGDGTDSVIVRVEVLDEEDKLDLQYIKPPSKWSNKPQADTSADTYVGVDYSELERRAATDEAADTSTGEGAHKHMEDVTTRQPLEEFKPSRIGHGQLLD